MFLAKHHLLTLAISAIILTGCGGNDEIKDSTKAEANHLKLAQSYKDEAQYRATLIETKNALQLNPSNANAYLIMAETYLEFGDTKGAAAALEKAVELNNPEIQNEINYLLADVLLRNNSAPEALLKINETVADNSISESQILLLKGKIQFTNQKKDAAKQTFKKLIELYPETIEGYVFLSKFAYAEKDIPNTELYLSLAEKKNANHLELWLWKGQLAILKNNLPAAEEALTQALFELPSADIMTAKKFTILSTLIEIFNKQGKTEDAYRYEQILAKSGPGKLKIKFERGLSLFKEQKTEEAKVIFLEIITEAPKHDKTGIMLGMIYYNDADYANAEKYLSKYLNPETSTDTAKRLLALSRLKIGKPEEAIATLDATTSQNNPDDLSILGMASMVAGDDARGQASLEKALKLDPSRHALRLKLAESYLRQQDHENALATIANIPENDEVYIRSLVIKAATYVSMGDHEKALAIADQIKTKQPDSYFGYNTAAGIYLDLKDYDKAIAQYEKSLSIDPKNTTAFKNLSRIFILTKQYDKAELNFARLAKAVPESTDAFKGYVTIGELNNSIDIQMKKITTYMDIPENAIAAASVLMEYFLRNEQPEQALKVPENHTSLSNNPDIKQFTLVAHVQIAKDLMGKSDFTGAINHLTLVNSLQPDDLGVLRLLTIAENANGNIEKTNQLITQIKTKYPESVIGYELEGDVFRQKNDDENALKSYKQGWIIQHTSSLAMKISGQLRKQGKNDEAIQPLKQLAQESPDNAQALTLLANTYLELGKTELAIEQFESILKLTPQNIIALNNLAWLYTEQQNKRALTLGEQAYNLRPDNPNIADTYGWALVKFEQKEKGIKILETALESDPNNKDLKAHLDEARK